MDKRGLTQNQQQSPGPSRAYSLMKVWNHFELHNEKPDSSAEARCKWCTFSFYLPAGSTSSIVNFYKAAQSHLNIHHLDMLAVIDNADLRPLIPGAPTLKLPEAVRSKMLKNGLTVTPIKCVSKTATLGLPQLIRLNPGPQTQPRQPGSSRQFISSKVQPKTPQSTNLKRSYNTRKASLPSYNFDETESSSSDSDESETSSAAATGTGVSTASRSSTSTQKATNQNNISNANVKPKPPKHVQIEDLKTRLREGKVSIVEFFKVTRTKTSKKLHCICRGCNHRIRNPKKSVMRSHFEKVHPDMLKHVKDPGEEPSSAKILQTLVPTRLAPGVVPVTKKSFKSWEMNPDDEDENIFSDSSVSENESESESEDEEDSRPRKKPRTKRSLSLNIGQHSLNQSKSQKSQVQNDQSYPIQTCTGNAHRINGIPGTVNVAKGNQNQVADDRPFESIDSTRLSHCLLCSGIVIPGQKLRQMKDTFKSWNRSCSTSLCKLLDLDPTFRNVFQQFPYCQPCEQLVQDIDWTFRSITSLQETLTGFQHRLNFVLSSSYNMILKPGRTPAFSTAPAAPYDQMLKTIVQSAVKNVRAQPEPDPPVVMNKGTKYQDVPNDPEVVQIKSEHDIFNYEATAMEDCSYDMPVGNPFPDNSEPDPLLGSQPTSGELELDNFFAENHPGPGPFAVKPVLITNAIKIKRENRRDPLEVCSVVMTEEVSVQQEAPAAVFIPTLPAPSTGLSVFPIFSNSPSSTATTTKTVLDLENSDEEHEREIKLEFESDSSPLQSPEIVTIKPESEDQFEPAYDCKTVFNTNERILLTPMPTDEREHKSEAMTNSFLLEPSPSEIVSIATIKPEPEDPSELGYVDECETEIYANDEEILPNDDFEDPGFIQNEVFTSSEGALIVPEFEVFENTFDSTL